MVYLMDLDDSKVTIEKEFHVNITKTKNKIGLSMHYNGRNSVLYADLVQIYQFQAKNIK